MTSQINNVRLEHGIGKSGNLKDGNLSKNHEIQSYYISFPDKQIIELTLRKPKKIRGREILEKTCKINEILETDSFGLQYIGRRGEWLWINLKNTIYEEIGPRPNRKRHHDFYKFYFRVKYYLHPQMVFTEGAKNVYYGEVKGKFLKGGFNLSIQDQISVSGFIAQAEIGSVEFSSGQIDYGLFIPVNLKAGTEKLFFTCLSQKHRSLKELTRQVCIQRCLAVLSDNKEYGMQWYRHLNILMTSEGDGSHSIPVDMGIGPEYVYICTRTGEEIYSFHIGLVENLQRTNKGYCVVHLREEGEEEGGEETVSPGRKLMIGGLTPFISIELFRVLAERATFYLSDSVIDQIKDEVATKQCQSWTKSEARHTVYTYDLLRNMKESYSDLLGQLSAPRVSFLRELPSVEGEREGTLLGSQCKLCYDSFVSVVFKDCGHAVTCAECLFKLRNCPVCRGDVKLSHLTPLITPLN